MRTGLMIGGLLGALALGTAPARAAIVYQNLPDLSLGEIGNCLFNSACATASGFPQRYAAQEFTLGGDALISAIGFTTVLQQGSLDGPPPTYGTIANWMLLAADGVGGLPGTQIASGTGATLSYVTGTSGTLAGLTTEYSFNIAAVALTAGTSYYVALQEFSYDPNDYLLQGLASAGASDSQDGGSTWSGGYAGQTSVAVTLYGESIAVAEPGSVLLMGSFLLGLTLHRRRSI